MSEWSADEQKALEQAMRKYPASMDKKERWASISAAVPGRSARDCVDRVRAVSAALNEKAAADKAAADKAAVESAATKAAADQAAADKVAAEKAAAAKAAVAKAAADKAAADKVAADKAASKKAAADKAAADKAAADKATAAAEAKKRAVAEAAKKNAKAKLDAEAKVKAEQINLSNLMLHDGSAAEKTPAERDKAVEKKEADKARKARKKAEAAAAKASAASGGDAEGDADAPSRGEKGAKGRGGKGKGSEGRGGGEGGRGGGKGEKSEASDRGDKGGGKGGKGGKGGGGKGGGGKGGRGGKDGRWWQMPPYSTMTDPITLEPLYKLRIPPFQLLSDPALAHATPSDHFDGRILAAYLVSSCNFTHPNSRREISREECVALDEWLTAHSQGAAQVAEAWEHRKETSPDPGGRVARLRIEANSIFAALFAGRDTPSAAAPGRQREQPEAVQRDGNLTVIDLDMVPGQLASLVGGGGGGGWAEAAAPEPAAEAFPGLPPAAAPRAPVVVARPPPRAPPAAAAPPKPADPKLAEEAARLAMLRDAFGRDASAPTSFAAESSVQFSAEALAVARAQPTWVASIEELLASFIAGGKRRESLPPMPKVQRAIVHELATLYGLATASYDNEPRRHVDLFRTGNSFLPGVRLSDAAKASPAAVAAAAAAAAAAAFDITLTDVECSQAAVDTTLRQLAGEYTFQHSGRPADGSPMTVTLLFVQERSARFALEILGGGVRGSFRVAAPSWANKGKSVAPPSRGGGGGGSYGGGGGGSYGGGGGDDGRWGGLRGGKDPQPTQSREKNEVWGDDDDNDGVAAAKPTAATAPSAPAIISTPDPDLEEPDAWDDE